MKAFLKCACPHCSKPIEYAAADAGRAVPCPSCGQHLELPPAPPERPQRQFAKGQVYCLDCGGYGWPGKYTPGSFGVEALLWLLFCAPGLIYSVWRLTAGGNACQGCKSKNVIPIESPRARELMNR